jgi:hypothetical protein
MVSESKLGQTERGRAPRGDGWYVLNMRERSEEPNSIGLPADEAAKRYGASVEEATTDREAVYSPLPRREPTGYRDGLLPE